MTLLTFLSPEAVKVNVCVSGWQEAIRAAGHLLVSIGAATTGYTEAMVRCVEDNGPYIVISPGVALAHARPEEGALSCGVSLVTLAQPVRFGHPDNDPVQLVLAFAGADGEAHLRILTELARFLADADRLRAVLGAATPARVLEACRGVEISEEDFC